MKTKRVIAVVLMAVMVMTMFPVQGVASDGAAGDGVVQIQEGQLEVPPGQDVGSGYPISATRILDDGANFFGEPVDGWYVLEGDISDVNYEGSILGDYNLVLKKGNIVGDDVPWQCENLKLWGLKGNSQVVTIADAMIEGNGFTINGGNVNFDNTFSYAPWTINGGQVVVNDGCIGSDTMTINGGDVVWNQLYWNGMIQANGGYITIDGVQAMGKVFDATKNATVLVNTVEHDGRFDFAPRSIVFKGDEGRVKGQVTLEKDYTIPAGKTLTIPKDTTLKIGENVTLTNEGTIILEGTLDRSAANAQLVGEGSLTEPVIPTPPPYIPPTPKEPIYVTPEVPVAPAYGIGGNIGMTESQKIETTEILKATVEEIIQAGPNGDSQVERDVAREITSGNQMTFTVKTDSLRNTQLEGAKSDIKKIQAKLDETFGDVDHSIVEAFDIKVVADGSGKTIGNLTQLKGKLPFTVMLGEKTKGAYGIIRVHNGQAEYLPPADILYQENPWTLTFKGDQFSTYAVYSYDHQAPELNLENSKVKKVNVLTDNGLIKVNFDQMPGADGHKVYIKPAKTNGPWRWYKTTKDSLLIKRWNGKPLVKNGQYQIKVAALFNVNPAAPVVPTIKGQEKNADITQVSTIQREGLASDIKTVYSNRIGTRPAKMLTPKFGNITVKEHGNQFSLQAPVLRVYPTSFQKDLQYQFSYKLKGSKIWNKTGYSPSRVKHIKGLKKGKTYILALRYRYQSLLDKKTFVYSQVTCKTVVVR